MEAPSSSRKAANRHKRAADRAEKKRPPGESRPLMAKTKKQGLYIAALMGGDSAAAVGGAGTGKTYIASRIAAKKLLTGAVDKIIVARVTVSKAKHANGFLPGKLDAKMAPWLIPVIDGIRAEVSAQTLETWKNEGRFEIASFEHMRGRTFADAFVILDEAQNADLGDLRLFLTRIGENSQVVVTGDMDQIDIPDSGLATCLDLIERHNINMAIFEFTSDDVVRSQFAKAWVKAFAQREQKVVSISWRTAATDVNLDRPPAFLDTPQKSRRAAS